MRTSACMKPNPLASFHVLTPADPHHSSQPARRTPTPFHKNSPIGPQRESFCDFIDNFGNAAFRLPLGVIAAEFFRIADPPDMIAEPSRIVVGPAYGPADGSLCGCYRLDDRAIREPTTPYVVNRTTARVAK